MAPIGRKGGGQRRQQEPPRTEEWLAVPTPPGSERPAKRPPKRRPRPTPKRQPEQPPERPSAETPPEPRPRSVDKEISELRSRLAELEAARPSQAEELERIAGQALRAERRAAKTERLMLDAIEREQKAREELERASQERRSSASDTPEQLGELNSLSERADEVERRVMLVEEHIAKTAQTVEGLAAETPAVTEGPPPARAKRRTAFDPVEQNGPIDLNRADFDALRGLGLSVTQSARLLASRDVRGGFKSLDELDDLHDFPDDLIAKLKPLLRI
jgi:hypothetical protein